ncbi:hypothetical protein GCM10009764_70470 [Nocardia ninae]|uniref:Uncharacterized protein n=1 Tax=Nocardia ninae NBRC 108245 TaxID=1210091 RepID=A0A511MJV8_9NOCA|nr:hypothetical protein NN4_49260 [Nocardia ninae NBRC 108245]
MVTFRKLGQSLAAPGEVEWDCCAREVRAYRFKVECLRGEKPDAARGRSEN